MTYDADALREFNRGVIRARNQYREMPISHQHVACAEHSKRECACGKHTYYQDGVCRTCRTTKGEA